LWTGVRAGAPAMKDGSTQAAAFSHPPGPAHPPQSWQTSCFRTCRVSTASTHLVQPLGHKVCGEAALKLLLVLKGVVLLRIRHGACIAEAFNRQRRHMPLTATHCTRLEPAVQLRGSLPACATSPAAGYTLHPTRTSSGTQPHTLQHRQRKRTRLKPAVEHALTLSSTGNASAPDSNQQSKTSSMRRSWPLPCRLGMVRWSMKWRCRSVTCGNSGNGS